MSKFEFDSVDDLIKFIEFFIPTNEEVAIRADIRKLKDESTKLDTTIISNTDKEVKNG